MTLIVDCNIIVIINDNLFGDKKMAKYIVYIPYNTFTEHTVETDSTEQAREIAFNICNVDGELLNNLEVDDEHVDIMEIRK